MGVTSSTKPHLLLPVEPPNSFDEGILSLMLLNQPTPTEEKPTPKAHHLLVKGHIHLFSLPILVSTVSLKQIVPLLYYCNRLGSITSPW